MLKMKLNITIQIKSKYQPGFGKFPFFWHILLIDIFYIYFLPIFFYFLYFFFSFSFMIFFFVYMRPHDEYQQLATRGFGVGLNGKTMEMDLCFLCTRSSVLDD